jgi:hypothetical protein
MQKIALVAVAALLVLYASSCKDDKQPDPIPDPPILYDDYAKLKIGNYWIYQLFDVDSLGNGPALNEFDSTYVSKDTLINGNTYYFLASTIPYTNNFWLRDSLHYLVNEYGKIFFSSEDFTTAFVSMPLFFNQGTTDTTAWVTQKMVGKASPFITPMGEFTTSDFQTIYDMYPNHNQAGTRRVVHKRYSKNIGIVSETIPFFIENIRYREKRLIRYHVN